MPRAQAFNFCFTSVHFKSLNFWVCSITCLAAFSEDFDILTAVISILVKRLA